MGTAGRPAEIAQLADQRLHLTPFVFKILLALPVASRIA